MLLREECNCPNNRDSKRLRLFNLQREKLGAITQCNINIMT